MATALVAELYSATIPALLVILVEYEFPVKTRAFFKDRKRG